MTIVRVVVGGVLLVPPTVPLLRLARSTGPEHVISWKDDFWPQQWRIGTSWLAGSVMFQIFVPVIGVRLHQTVQQKPWWVETFRRLGLVHLEEYVRYFNTQFVRGPKFGAPGSFHLVLSSDPTKSPAPPVLGASARAPDHWIGSRHQRLLRTLVVGDQ